MFKSKSTIGKRNKQRGNSYERTIINELKKIYKDEEITSSRNRDRVLDGKKIDVCDPNNTIPFYSQIKITQQVPSIKSIFKEVGLKDKPLVIFWNAQEPKEKKQISVGEYVILQKDFFYSLIQEDPT